MNTLRGTNRFAALRARIGMVVVSFAMVLVCVFGLSMCGQTGSDMPPASVTVIADGGQWEYVSCQKTVGGILNEAGVSLGPKDRVFPRLSTPASPGMRIRVVRITEETIVQTEPISYKTRTRFNPYGRGMVVLREGVKGEKQVTYLVTRKDGVKCGCKPIRAVVLKPATDKVVSIGRGVALASRGGFRSVRTMRMLATAYDPSGGCNYRYHGRTATGMRAEKGVVAVDPRVIKLGTRLYVEGYGFCVAADTGGAIKGNKIDLCYNTRRECVQFGRRYVTVHILE